ncbi:MAG: patatin-like phospholipase family protein [Bryobacterales bacterium]|nr:patatin-like phospholipase family protein [Bryobacterales bacterium]
MTDETKRPLTDPTAGADSFEDAAPLDTALCLSGGGYRAMIFHLGALIRLNEAALLPKIDLFSSVSGGSITNGVLALNWNRLAFDSTGVAANLIPLVVDKVRTLADVTVDEESIVEGILWFGTISDHVAKDYDKHLYDGATLQDLPDSPRFVFNATNVQTRSLFRFSKPYAADYRIGLWRNPSIPLSKAVAASSAFPPVLSPCTLEADDNVWEPQGRGELCRKPYNTTLMLTDGGVYDNLGLESPWKRSKTIYVSDAGGGTPADPDPDTNWVGHSKRVLDLIDMQVRSLRKRMLISAYQSKQKNGAYFGIRQDISEYKAPGRLDVPFARSLQLAETPTRLKKMNDHLQEQLINWGYAIADAALRSYPHPELQPPKGLPYPASGI